MWPSKPPSRSAGCRSRASSRRSYHRTFDDQSALASPGSLLGAGSPHRLRHVLEELAGEVRGKLHGGEVGLHLVEILQAQHVLAHQLGNDPREEEAERFELRAERLR